MQLLNCARAKVPRFKADIVVKMVEGDIEYMNPLYNINAGLLLKTMTTMAMKILCHITTSLIS